MGLNQTFEGATIVAPGFASAGDEMNQVQTLERVDQILAQRASVDDGARRSSAARITLTTIRVKTRNTPRTGQAISTSPTALPVSSLAEVLSFVRRAERGGDVAALKSIHEASRKGLEVLGALDDTSHKVRDLLTPQEQTRPADAEAGSKPLSGERDDKVSAGTLKAALGHNSGLPAWFLDLKAKLESGAIPRYAGKWHDGDPVDFMLSHYKDVVDARVLTQAHLKALDRTLYDTLNNSFRGEKRHALSQILPPLSKFQTASIH